MASGLTIYRDHEFYRGDILSASHDPGPPNAALHSANAGFRKVVSMLERVAPTSATVLLTGETGSGKEVFAQAIHDQSPRARRQMIKVNCAGIPRELMESELFGCERGAFTGASCTRFGRFEAANHSTLFLDEIGELAIDLQVKLLRVLQTRVIERLGSVHPIALDVRIIAATNRDLEDAVEQKRFREDLFYRLNVFPLRVPPLREHAEDIPKLAWTFVQEFSRTFGKSIDSISDQSMRELKAYSWPGNVRELRNVIERAVILATGGRLTIAVSGLPCSQRSSTVAGSLRLHRRVSAAC